MVNQACHRNEISDTEAGSIGVSGKDKPLEADDCPVTCSSTTFYVQVYSDCTVDVLNGSEYFVEVGLTV